MKYQVYKQVSLISLGVMLALPSACTQPRPVTPLPVLDTPEIAQIEARDVGPKATILGGEVPVPPPPRGPTDKSLRGTIRLNFPSADIAVVAKAVLGDLLHLSYVIAPGTTGRVSLVTAGPVAKTSILELLEAALKNGGLALQSSPGGFTIATVSAAAQSGMVEPKTIGFGSQIIALQFINADEAKKLLDSVLPGVVTAVDTTSNRLTIAGTTGQRASAADIVRQFDVNWLRNMSFGLFVPERTDSRLLVPELDKLINAPDAPTRGLVRLISMEHLNGILAITAQRQYLDDVRRWVDILDREGSSNEAKLFVYRVQNGRARDLAKTLNAAFGTGGGTDAVEAADPFASNTTGSVPPSQPPTANAAVRNSNPNNAGATPAANGPANSFSGRISADDVNNAVIVFGKPRDYAVVEDALRKLDVLPYQVLIEAAITEVTLTDALRYGVQWNFQTGSSNFALTDNTTAAPSRVLPGFSYFLSNSDISATLNALEERTNIKVISAPKLLVLNNQTASLQVGDQVPILTEQQQSTGTNSAVINSVEYRDTGVILKVTPRVNGGGLVLLDIAQEVSDIAAQTSSGLNSPRISTRRVSTSIAVQDGQVIALGGLFRDSKSFGKSGLPILSRIPVLGSLLFGKTDNTQTRTELIVLIKPHVVRTIDDGRAVTEELRSKLRTLEPFRSQGTIP